MDAVTQLGYALLGLLHQTAMSGYDLRKVFTNTAMGSFSDSPGAIYPALARLERQGLVEGSVQDNSSLRKRKTFRLTPQGRQVLADWLVMPVTREDIIRGIGTLMLRFAFMDQVLGAEQSVRFLRQFADAIAAYIPGLETYLSGHSCKMPTSARLALDCGIQEYRMRLRWAESSIREYQQKVRQDA